MKQTLTSIIAATVIGCTAFIANLTAEEKNMNISNKDKAVAFLNNI